MKTFIKLFSTKKGEINRFLKQFYCNKNTILNSEKTMLEWELSFENPVEMADIVGVFMDNKEDFNINLWACLDKDILINITENNVDSFIRYLYERFPY